MAKGANAKLGDALSLRMRHFAEVFDGDAKAAAVKAGYSAKNAKSQGSRLLADQRVAAIIRSREAARTNGDIMKREERQKWWSAIVRDETRPLPERLKAIEQLARSEGDFLDRAEVAHKLPAVLPERLDEETLIFIARGGLRAAVGATSPAQPEGTGDDGDDAEATD